MTSTASTTHSPLRRTVPIELSALRMIALAGLLIAAHLLFGLRVGKLIVLVAFLGGMGIVQILLAAFLPLPYTLRTRRYGLLAVVVAMLLTVGALR